MKKSCNILTFDDLSSQFITNIEDLIGSAKYIAFAFDTDDDISLKNATKDASERKARKGLHGILNIRQSRH